MAAAASDGAVEVPRFGHRITRLSRDVYALNLQMLRLLREDSIGRAAPQEVRWAAPQEIATDAPGRRPVLQIGDQGREKGRYAACSVHFGGPVRTSASTGGSGRKPGRLSVPCSDPGGSMLTASRDR